MQTYEIYTMQISTQNLPDPDILLEYDALKHKVYMVCLPWLGNVAG